MFVFLGGPYWYVSDLSPCYYRRKSNQWLHAKWLSVGVDRDIDDWWCSADRHWERRGYLSSLQLLLSAPRIEDQHRSARPRCGRKDLVGRSCFPKPERIIHAAAGESPIG